MNVSDDNEITAGGTAVHRQAMVLRQSTRYLGAVGGSSGVRDLFIRIDRHCVSYYCIVVMCHVSSYLPVCVCVCVWVGVLVFIRFPLILYTIFYHTTFYILSLILLSYVLFSSCIILRVCVRCLF